VRVKNREDEPTTNTVDSMRSRREVKSACTHGLSHLLLKNKIWHVPTIHCSAISPLFINDISYIDNEQLNEHYISKNCGVVMAIFEIKKLRSSHDRDNQSLIVTKPT